MIKYTLNCNRLNQLHLVRNIGRFIPRIQYIGERVHISTSDCLVKVNAIHWNSYSVSQYKQKLVKSAIGLPYVYFS